MREVPANRPRVLQPWLQKARTSHATRFGTAQLPDPGSSSPEGPGSRVGEQSSLRHDRCKVDPRSPHCLADRPLLGAATHSAKPPAVCLLRSRPATRTAPSTDDPPTSLGTPIGHEHPVQSKPRRCPPLQKPTRRARNLPSPLRLLSPRRAAPSLGGHAAPSRRARPAASCLLAASTTRFLPLAPAPSPAPLAPVWASAAEPAGGKTPPRWCPVCRHLLRMRRHYASLHGNKFLNSPTNLACPLKGRASVPKRPSRKRPALPVAARLHERRPPRGPAPRPLAPADPQPRGASKRRPAVR
mmetsp:Transcript_22639/g.77354  ORF Transcript_22639/g.77354 Transcript_22639/m.77354 type:complete len:299 (-) Transcript_22639:477-1373(-)